MVCGESAQDIRRNVVGMCVGFPLTIIISCYSSDDPNGVVCPPVSLRDIASLIIPSLTHQPARYRLSTRQPIRRAANTAGMFTRKFNRKDRDRATT